MKDEYYNFNVDAYFYPYCENKKRLQDLRAELEEIADSMSMDYSTPKVDGGLAGSTVENKANRREQIAEKIVALEKYFLGCDLILAQLDPTEKYIIREYYMSGNKGKKAINNIREYLDYSESKVYRSLNKIKHKIRVYVTERRGA